MFRLFLSSLAILAVGISPSIAQAGDDSLELLLDKADTVIVVEPLADVHQVIVTENFIHEWQQPFKIAEVLKGKVKAGETVNWTMRARDMTRRPEKGKKYILFVNAESPVDLWFGVQRYSYELARALSFIIQRQEYSRVGTTR